MTRVVFVNPLDTSLASCESYGLNPRKVSRKLKEAYLRFYLRPGYFFKRPSMIKSVLFGLYHSYFRPAFRQSDPQGWYRNLSAMK